MEPVALHTPTPWCIRLGPPVRLRAFGAGNCGVITHCALIVLAARERGLACVRTWLIWAIRDISQAARAVARGGKTNGGVDKRTSERAMQCYARAGAQNALPNTRRGRLGRNWSAALLGVPRGACRAINDIICLSRAERTVARAAPCDPRGRGNSPVRTCTHGGARWLYPIVPYFAAIAITRIGRRACARPGVCRGRR